tara:strand:- start:309 stop:824 length:516 start_codon:yes stop_codon:yes gene_type:complete
MTDLEQIKEDFMATVGLQNDAIAPIFGYLDKKGNATVLDTEIIQSLVNDHKPKMRAVLKSYLTKRLAQGEDIDTIFFFSEVYYKKVTPEEATELKKEYIGLANDNLAEEAILIYTESKSTLKQVMHSIYYNSKDDSRYVDKTPKEVCNIETDSKEFQEVLNHGQLVGFLPR